MHAKNSTALSAANTEWYIKAALNYSLAKAWIEYNTQVVDPLKIFLPLSTDGVSLSDAHAAFNELVSELQGLEIESIQHLALVDVEAKTEGHALKCIVRYIVGSGYEKSLNISYPAWYAILPGLCSRTS